MKAPQNDFARWIAERGLTDQEVADQLAAAGHEISRPQISKLRRGISRPSWETAEAIKALTEGRVTFESFFTSQPSGAAA